MAWRIELTSTADKSLRQMGSEPARRIIRFLSERLGSLEDPRSLGSALSGSRLGELWRYRVGDYRIVAKIEDTMTTVLVVQIGHRREVYRS